MLDLALKAHIPIVAVTTDDIINLPTILAHLTEKSALAWPASKAPSGHAVYWTLDPKDVTVQAYGALQAVKTTLVVVNAAKNDIAFDAGEVDPPKELLAKALGQWVVKDLIPASMKILKGLSIKAALNVVALTRAKVATFTLADLRKVRALLQPAQQGLYPVDVKQDFYMWPELLKDWLDLNSPYFLQSDIAALRPRGLLLDGSPGVGKGSSAKAIAEYLKVPLYRLDISTTLDKFIGVAENRVAAILRSVEEEAPCVLLLDEIEKIFSQSEDTGTTTRIMSMLLWWLAEHQSRVLTIMTTNDRTKLPPELYRPGRIDKVVVIPKLHFMEAQKLAHVVFSKLTGKQPTLVQTQTLALGLKANGQVEFAHSEVVEMVKDQIKKAHLVKPLQ